MDQDERSLPLDGDEVPSGNDFPAHEDPPASYAPSIWDKHFELDRRQFLKLSGLTLGTFSVLSQLEGIEKAAAAVVGRALPAKTLSATLRRREDFLELGFDFYNLILRQGEAGPQLVLANAAVEGWIVIQFPPQHLLEEAFRETESPSTTDPLKTPGTVGARLSGPSRLAFVVPTTVGPIPYSAQGLLAWAAWVQKVVPAARPYNARGTPPLLREALPFETAIELPWWLILSPSSANGSLWSHRALPRTVEGRTELWHTNLNPAVFRGSLTPPATRAVWARDWDGGSGPPQDRPIGQAPGQRGFVFKEQSLKPINRVNIVLSSTVKGTRPTPLDVDRLMLTALGGWLDVKGNWNTQSTGLELESWTHRATGGRDQYVQVVDVGFLMPFGHRAVRVEITERKPGVPAGGPASQAAGYLRKRMFIVVRQPAVTYPTAADANGGRGLPFTEVRLLTKVTPKLDPEGTMPLTPLLQADKGFIPTVGNSPFLFDAVGIDHEGREIPFATPLAFVLGGVNNVYHQGTLALMVSAYSNLDVPGPEAHSGRPDVQLGGRPVAFAPPGNTPGSTRYDTRAIRLRAALPSPFNQTVLDGLFAQGVAPFSPLLERAEVRLEAAEVVGGKGVGWQAISYHPPYFFSGMGAAEVFAKLESPQAVGFATEGRGGGVVTPNMTLTGLSRSLGSIGGDLNQVDAGGAAAFDPADWFSGAKLLGGLNLADVVATGDINKMPTLRSTTLGPPGSPGPGESPVAIESVLQWHPALQPKPPLSLLSSADLTVTARFRRDLLDPAKSTSSIRGELRGVKLTLAPGAEFIAVSLNRLAFSSEDGKKTDVRVDVGGVEFLGALDFIAALTKYIKPVDGTPSGPFLDVSPSRVLAGLAFALPAVQVGAFVIENAAVRNELALPLDGKPVTNRFAFSSREDPFHLTVLGFGGGGFVAVEVGADGPKALDVCLEAGAMVAINVGVAKGKLEAFAGFYYRLEGQKAVYEAFVRMSGSLRVLGLVTVSAKFYLEMDYDDGSNKFHGSASITYSIDMGVYEKSVKVKVSRKFGRDSSDPFLIERVSQPQWNQYCLAFAQEALS